MSSVTRKREYYTTFRRYAETEDINATESFRNIGIQSCGGYQLARVYLVLVYVMGLYS